MDPELKPYLISLSEMVRRKKAYTTLIISLFFGIVLSTLDLFISYPVFSIYSLTGLTLLFIISRLLFFRLFRKIAGTKIILSDTKIERVIGKSSEHYQLNAIIRLLIKRTVKKSIREIKIKFNDKNYISITGLQDFEMFRQNLQERVKKDVPAVEFKELIDFDHPLFYVFFGFFTGLITTSIMRLLTTLDSHILQWIQVSVICFLVSMGTYWILNRPISRDGISKPFIDYLFGTLVLITSMIIAIYSFLTILR